MSAEFEALLRLTGAAALGENVRAEIKDFSGLCALAERHGCAPLIIDRLCETYEKGKTNMSRGDFTDFRRRAYYSVMKSDRRAETVRDAVTALEREGIVCAVLKGGSLSRLYSQPERRISGDTDLYVGDCDMTAAVKALQSRGFEIKADAAYSHHICGKHKSGGLVELHSRLYDEMMEQVWFDGLILPTEDFSSFAGEDGGEYKMLGPTDNAIFTFLHFVKPFLTSGLKIRQLIDMLMCLCKTPCDRRRFDETVTSLGYDIFADCCISIGTRYCGFPEIPLVGARKIPEAAAEELMNFMECGGRFVRSDQYSFREMYTRRRYEEKTGGGYWKFKRKSWREKILVRLFPPRYAMGGRYSYCIRRGYLLPAAWVHRLCYMLIQTAAGKRRQPRPSGNEGDRLALAEKLGMV
ncbi:MAG: nucleotidyltransferase family protein [Clostridia bacterium]